MSNSNEPAYPLPEYPRANGMSKRERFAMAAMQGMCADHNSGSCKVVAENAVSFADALLNELEE